MLDVAQPIFAFTRIFRIKSLAYLRQQEQQEQHAQRAVPTAEVRPFATPGHQLFWSAFKSLPGDYVADFKRLKDRDGARERAGAALGLHLLIGISPEWIMEGGDLHDAANPRLLDLFAAARAWAEAAIGGVYAMRIDLDERGGGVVDVFASPSFDRPGRPKKDGSRGPSIREISVKKALQGLQRAAGGGKSFAAAQTLWARHAREHLDVRIVRGVPKTVTGRVHVPVPAFRQALEECRALREQRDGELSTLLTTVKLVDEQARSLADRGRAQDERDDELNQRASALDFRHEGLDAQRREFLERRALFLSEMTRLEAAAQDVATREAELRLQRADWEHACSMEARHIADQRLAFETEANERTRTLTAREAAVAEREVRNIEFNDRLRIANEDLGRAREELASDRDALERDAGDLHSRAQAVRDRDERLDRLERAQAERINDERRAIDVERTAVEREKEDARAALAHAADTENALRWGVAEIAGGSLVKPVDFEGRDDLDLEQPLLTQVLYTIEARVSGERNVLAEESKRLTQTERRAKERETEADKAMRQARAAKDFHDQATFKIGAAVSDYRKRLEAVEIVRRELDEQTMALQLERHEAEARNVAALEAIDAKAKALAGLTGKLRIRREFIEGQEFDLAARRAALVEHEQTFDTRSSDLKLRERAFEAGVAAITSGELETVADVDARPRLRPARDFLVALVKRIEGRRSDIAFSLAERAQEQKAALADREAQLVSRENHAAASEQSVEAAQAALASGLHAIEKWGPDKASHRIETDAEYRPARAILKRVVATIDAGVSRATMALEEVGLKARKELERADREWGFAKLERAAAAAKTKEAEAAEISAKEREKAALERMQIANAFLRNTRLVVEAWESLHDKLPARLQQAMHALSVARRDFVSSKGRSKADI